MKTYQEIIEELSLPAGPQMKSEATYDLEKVLSAFSLGLEVVFEYNFQGELEVIIDGDVVYNLTKIIEYADFSHLTLDDSLHSYYLNLFAVGREYVPDDYNCNYDEEGYFKERQQRKREKYQINETPLTHAEQVAIYLYTRTGYEGMNSILRGGATGSGMTSDHFVRTLFTVCLAATGLSKPGNEEIDASDQVVFRGERNVRNENRKKSMDAVIGHRLGNLEAGEPTIERAFLSTDQELNGKFSKDIVLEIRQPKGFGAIGKKIAHLSNANDENEILFPPKTSIYYYDYEEVDGKYKFKGVPVRPVNDEVATAYSSKCMSLRSYVLFFIEDYSKQKNKSLDPFEEVLNEEIASLEFKESDLPAISAMFNQLYYSLPRPFQGLVKDMFVKFMEHFVQNVEDIQTKENIKNFLLSDDPSVQFVKHFRDRSKILDAFPSFLCFWRKDKTDTQSKLERISWEPVANNQP